MVLYGYDASTFNSVQGSDNWLEWFNLTSDSTYMLGLINTVYSIGAIVSGWFIGGPVVSSSSFVTYGRPAYVITLRLTLNSRPTTSVVERAWVLVASSPSALQCCKHLPPRVTSAASWPAVSSLVSAREWL
jgi:hypothetical protein